ncbi:MAG: cation transporter [Pseudomonadota bacterium]
MNSAVTIKGMSCQHCAMAVKKALASLDGVTGVEVNLEKGEASISHNSPIDLEEVRLAVEKSGYELG